MVNDHDGRDDVHAGRINGIEDNVHALPSGPMYLATGIGMVDSIGRPPIVYASNYDITPGAFPVRSALNTATSRTPWSPMSSYDSPSAFVNEESRLDDGVPNSAAAGSGLYTVRAQWVPDGNEMVVVEAQYVSRMKWYQRRWIFVGLACCLVGTLVVIVVLVLRQPSGATSSSSLTAPPTVPSIGAPFIPDPTAPPTPKPISTAPPTRAPITRRPTSTSKPTSLTPLGIACNFVSIPNVTKCRSTFEFDSWNDGDTANGDKTNGFVIPSEIGLLTQLTSLDFYEKSLTSTIPSEIGLLTQLTYLDLRYNSLTSTIPSEIGLLAQLTILWSDSNELKGTIPSEIGLLTQLQGLSFSANALTSTLPSEIGMLTLMEYLDFMGNSLTSTIPSEIGLLTQLESLYLYFNTLTGTIPSSFCSLPYLNGNIMIDDGEITCDEGCCVPVVPVP